MQLLGTVTKIVHCPPPISETVTGNLGSPRAMGSVWTRSECARQSQAHIFNLSMVYSFLYSFITHSVKISHTIHGLTTDCIQISVNKDLSVCQHSSY